MSAFAAGIVSRLEEAIRILELRRYRRILSAGRMPFVFAAAVFVVAGVLTPFLFADGAILAGRNPISHYPSWGAGVLLTTSALAAILAAYLRAQHLWTQERRLQTFHTWLLSRQSPARAAATTVAMSALLGLALTAVPVVLGLLFALFSGFQWWQFLEYLLLLPLCAFLGAALGTAVFFIGYNLAPRWLYYPALVSFVFVVVGLWYRCETVQGGWHRGWDEHPARIVWTLAMATPVPALFGLSVPRWWDSFGPPGLGVGVPAWGFPLLYAAFLALAAFCLASLGVRGYLALADDPDLLEEKPQTPTEEGGQEFYWKGFRNPVWTRDIRTRLRSRDTAEFIFFASLAVAAGGFVPLIMTASDLSDPLQTARAARQVFFWLTMTLVALVALITPSLTADSITQERATGTLEFLVSTPLRPREILVGKVLGAVSVMLVLIAPSLPLFGLCYLFHGAAADQVVKVYLLLLFTLAVSALIGITQSAIHAKAGQAKFWAYGLTALFVAVPGGPFWVAAAVAAPGADMRQTLTNSVAVAALVMVFAMFGMVLCWGNACEELEYSEY